MYNYISTIQLCGIWLRVLPQIRSLPFRVSFLLSKALLWIVLKTIEGKAPVPATPPSQTETTPHGPFLSSEVAGSAAGTYVLCLRMLLTYTEVVGW